MTFWCTAFQIFCRFIFAFVYLFLNLPRWLSSKESACQWRRGRRCGFDPWVRKTPWRREWQPTPIFLPGESHGQRSLVGYSPWGCKESDMTERLTFKYYLPHTPIRCLNLSIIFLSIDCTV